MPSVRLTHRTAEAVEAILSRKERDMATTTTKTEPDGQGVMPGVESQAEHEAEQVMAKRELWATDWARVESFRDTGKAHLETAADYADGGSERTQRIAEVLASLGKAHLSAARQIETILSKD